MFLHSLSSFLDKHCICRHKCKFSEIFAYAKVKLLCSEVRAKLLCNFYAPSEVKFAHFAEGKTSLSAG